MHACCHRATGPHLFPALPALPPHPTPTPPHPTPTHSLTRPASRTHAETHEPAFALCRDSKPEDRGAPRAGDWGRGNSPPRRPGPGGPRRDMPGPQRDMPGPRRDEPGPRRDEPIVLDTPVLDAGSSADIVRAMMAPKGGSGGQASARPAGLAPTGLAPPGMSLASATPAELAAYKAEASAKAAAKLATMLGPNFGGGGSGAGAAAAPPGGSGLSREEKIKKLWGSKKAAGAPGAGAAPGAAAPAPASASGSDGDADDAAAVFGSNRWDAVGMDGGQKSKVSTCLEGGNPPEGAGGNPPAHLIWPQSSLS